MNDRDGDGHSSFDSILLFVHALEIRVYCFCQQASKKCSANGSRVLSIVQPTISSLMIGEWKDRGEFAFLVR